jgi:hypothetical protein
MMERSIRAPNETHGQRVLQPQSSRGAASLQGSVRRCKDNSDHQFGVDVDADGIKKSACGRFVVRVWQHTNGHDTWKFNGSVQLKFSDGTNLEAHRDNIVLVNDNAYADFYAPQ